MPSSRTEPARPPSRRQARDIIDAVVENMRQNLETLKYSTLAPSRYTVYLHPAEYARLEGIVPIVREQTIRALTDELAQLNAGPVMRRWVRRFVSDSEPEIRSAADWQVEFLADPDGDMNEGDLLVDSELVLPASPELGVGERTRRITTVHSGQRTATREQTVSRPQPASGPGNSGSNRVQRRRRPPFARRGQGLADDRPRRRRISGGHPHLVLSRRVP